MADKYWWEEDQQDKKQQNQRKGYWWDDSSVASTAAQNITNRVNTWLKNHNTYLSNFQKRNSGRKFNYEDSYVSDSADWLNTVSQQKSNFDAEADSIISYMSQYKDYLDLGTINRISDTLAEARKQQRAILDGATRDNEWWNSFGSEEMVKAHGSAEEAYKYYQRADGYKTNYTGATGDDILKAIDTLGVGEEKDWLRLNQGKIFGDTIRGNTDFQDYVTKGSSLSYTDFGTETSHKGKSRRQRGYTSIDKYRAASLALAEHYGNEAPLGTYDAYDEQVAIFRTMDDKEFENLAYCIAYDKENGTNTAEQYVDFMEETLSSRRGTDIGEKVTSIDIPVLEDLAVLGYGAIAGVNNFAFGLEQFMSDEELAYYPSHYANAHIADSLDGFGYYAHSAATNIGNMAPSILLSAVATGLGAPSKVAEGLGSATMGVSASGNAYKEALSKGYDKESARTYGNFVGASEGLLQYLIGGIGKLGGMSGKIAGKVSAIDNALLRGAAKYGVSIGSEIVEEEIQNFLEPAFRSIIFGEDYDAPTIDAIIETAIVTALSTGVLEGGSTYRGIKGDIALDKQAVKDYGANTDALIQEGLESDVNSESYKLATKYQQQVQGKDGKGGKAMTGFQIRNLLAANQEQVTKADLEKIQNAAANRLAKAGLRENIDKIAELATKYATGQEMTRAERSTLANNKYGAQVTSELLRGNHPDNLLSKWENNMSDESGAEYSTEWTGDIGTESDQFLRYNSKKLTRTILERMANMSADGPNAYKSLESRMEADEPAQVSDTGKAVIRATGEEVDLTSPTFKKITKDGVVLDVNGKTVRSNEIDYDTGDQGIAINGISKIEHITPEAATALYAKLDMTKSVMKQLNGMDEAFTYGFYNYPEADLEAGNFAGNLTQDQKTDAYKLGQYVAKNTVTENKTAIKNMRTAADAIAEKAAKDGKEAPKSKKLSITYNHGGGVIEDIATAEKKLGKLEPVQRAGIEVAKILHQMGIGTDYELFTSYWSKDDKGNPIEVFLNDEGQEEAAYAGVHMAADGKIRINLNAYSGTKGLTLNALSHELTHFIKTWSLEKYEAMADFLVKSYGEKGVSMHKLVLKEQARLKKIRNGAEVSYSEAYDEVVANAFNRMLEDGKVMDRIAEIRQFDKSLADKIIECIRNFINLFTKEYQKNKSLFKETEALMEMKEVFEQLQNMFAEALVDASENFQAAQQVGFEVDTQTKSVAPAVAMKSENTWKQSDYVQERDKAAKEISKAIGVTEQKAKDYIDSINSVAKMIAEDRSRLDYFSSPGRTSFVGNVEYGGSFDFSTLCKKRRLLTGTFTAIQKALPNTALTADEILDIRNRMKEANLEVSCGLCYVEGSRANMGQFAKEFLRLYKQYYPDAWQPNMADVNTPDGIEWVRINHPECYEQYEYFWNHYGTLKDGDKNLFASQQKPKLYQLHTEYKGEILDKFKDDDNVEEKNLNGGIRLQSFSDFEIVHLIDTMQIIMDMSRVGLAGQAYTKVPDFAWALGDTGLKINLSLIAKGVDENGKLIFDDVEGMPIAEAMKLRDRYSKNVGTILVAFNDEQLLAAMDDDRVDFIIPFHRSQWKKSQYEAMGLPAKTKDYTYMQNEKYIKPQFHEYRGRMVKDKATNYMPNEYWDFSKSGKENAEAYLEMCARNNKRPKFYKLLQNNGDGSYSLKADGSTDGYWKLLIDFKMYDNEGNGSPQMAVKPEFNMEEANRMLNDYKGGHSNFPVAQGIVDSFVKDYKASHKGVQYSSQETDLDTQTDSTYDSAKKETKQEVKANVTREEVSHRVDAESPRKVGKENSGRESSERESCERRIKEILRKKASSRSKKSTYGRGRVELRETRESFENRSRRDGLMYVEVGSVAIACKVAPEASWNENAKAAAEKLAQCGFEVVVYTGELRHNQEGVTGTSVDGTTFRQTIFISSELDIDGMETAYHEAFHATRRGVFAMYHEKIVNIIASNVDIESEAFDQFVSVIADLYAYTESNVSADKFTAEIIEEFYAWYVGKAIATQSGDMQEYMAEFSDVETIKEQIDGVYAQMEANADTALPGLLEGNEEGQALYSSQQTDIDTEGMSAEAKKIISNLKLRASFSRISKGEYASYSAERIERELDRSSSATQMDYAKSYIAWVNPIDFLYATTTSDAGRAQIEKEAGELDLERLRKQTQPIHLTVDFDTGKIVGHEGRHRMIALHKAGVEKVAVIFDAWNDDRYNTKPVDMMMIGGQEFGRYSSGLDFFVHDMLPLSKRYAEATKKLFSEVGGSVKFSTQQTDNITDRDMLANAFETISKSSEEYKMIQDYKSNVERLNKLARELDEVNQKIRDIRFGKGKYDKEQLKLLDSKATELAKEITKYDKRLLNMEASGPLRKVIERERKKEAQKTKEHVKEIQQNKKTRAEQAEYRHKIRKTIRELDKLLKRGNKQRNVKEDMKGFVSKALELADYLFTDHVSNDDLIRNGITVRMTPKEAALVKETEDILSKLYDNADSLTDEEFTRLDTKRKANEDKLRDLLTAQRNERLNTPVYKLFNDLVTEYASLQNSNQDAVRAAYNSEVERLLRSFAGDEDGKADTDRKNALENMRVADMTTEELWKLYNAYTMVLTTVRDANKLHVKGKLVSIDNVVADITRDFSKRKIPDKKVAIIARNIANKLGWDYEKLYYALDRIGSEAFTELVMNIANSENIVMQDIMEAAAFRDEIVKKYGFNNWDVNKEIDREFLDTTGKKFKLTLGELMSLYAYSRREGAWDHIEYGGFVFGEAALTNPKPADSYKLTKEQCEAITNTLTKEQKGYVEDMQKFLSETMGEKGNEVSMLLYGIKMFGEKNYFPIHIAGQFKAQANESQAKAAAGFSSMSNAGFTHAQNPKAKAPFVLEGFNDIWADHVNEMSRYHGTVPALEDMRRVMNRSSYSESTAESMAIKQLMENSFGKEAVAYFDNLYREANSGAITDKLQKDSKWLLSKFRKNSVAYSLSVLVQQPASLVRAYAMIDKKYFGFKGFGTITSGVAKAVSNKWTKAHTNAYNEMLKYAPGVTMAKEIGGFDTATGGSIRSYLLDTNKSIRQKWQTENAVGKGKAVMDLVDNNAIANLPNVADKIAWIEIWNACKRETVAKHKDLATNSEEFMKAVGERFTEVIRATQVYDSIFAKSPMLKSKNLAVQYLVSFMNEPNVIANMAESAVRDATRGNWKSGVRTAAVLIHSVIFTNLLKSIVYAMRDDDEDETYIEKYLEAVTGNMMDDFIALNYIPLARDVWSLAQGYDVERADMAIVADAIDALNRVIKNGFTETEGMTEDELIEFDKKCTEANWKLVESLASFFGIPVKNIRREIEGVLDHAKIASANAGQTTAQSAWDKVYDAVIESIPFIQTKRDKQDKLYDAIISGDLEYLSRLKSTYKDEDAYQNAVRKALRANDSRIHDAAQAKYEGRTEDYKHIFREIQKEGKFSFDDIMSAVNSEESAIRNGLEPDKVTSSYTASDFVESIVLGDPKSAEAMKDDIIASKVANGKTQANAEKEFISSVATGIRDAYSSGLLDEARAEEMLVEYAGKDEEEAASKVNYWAFCEAHPQYELTESNVTDYQEFAEPAEIPLDVFVQYVNGTKGLASKYDEWGDVEVTKREQVLEVIDSLPLTWQQKDALYLAAGYSEDKIWDVPW